MTPPSWGSRTTNRVHRVHFNLERTACTPCMQAIIKYILDMVMDLDPAVQLIHTSTALPLASTSTIQQYCADRLLLEALGRTCTRLQYIQPLLDVLLEASGIFGHKLGRTFDPWGELCFYRAGEAKTSDFKFYYSWRSHGRWRTRQPASQDQEPHKTHSKDEIEPNLPLSPPAPPPPAGPRPGAASSALHCPPRQSAPISA